MRFFKELFQKPEEPRENLSFQEKTKEKLRERFQDPSFLPTHKEIAMAFGAKKMFSEEWHNLFHHEENHVFELLNEEYVNALNDYLSERIKNIEVKEDEPIIILEVGAGNGRLTHFLKEKLKEKYPNNGVEFIATDSNEGTSGIKIKPGFPVENLDQEDALKKYNPQIVLSSYMPYGKDFTEDFRNTKSVKEYILIGEISCCGDLWKTWGDDLEYNNNDNELPPYKSDGFDLYHLEKLRKHQICQSDEPYICLADNHCKSNSSTVSFRRK